MTRDDQNDFRSVPQGAEAFGTVRKDSEAFGSVPKDVEVFRRVPKVSERRENHTLTVKETARMFEAAGVARTERSIVNWCQPNKDGISRLDCYFDPNERKYFITPQSVELAIKEEQAKAAKAVESAEPVGSSRNDGKGQPSDSVGSETDASEVKGLRQEILDLKITNRAKDMFIEQMQEERKGYVERLIAFSSQVGELKTRLLQLGAGDNSPTGSRPISEGERSGSEAERE